MSQSTTQKPSRPEATRTASFGEVPDAEVVRFATAGDEDLFVTRYQLNLPSEEQLIGWLHKERARIEQVREGQDETEETDRDDGGRDA